MFQIITNYLGQEFLEWEGRCLFISDNNILSFWEDGPSLTRLQIIVLRSYLDRWIVTGTFHTHEHENMKGRTRSVVIGEFLTKLLPELSVDERQKLFHEISQRYCLRCGEEIPHSNQFACIMRDIISEKE